MPKIQITKENMTEIFEKIKSIQPRNSTNIELALEKTREIMYNDSEDSPTSHHHRQEQLQKTEIFLTDGLPTAGDTNITRLIKKQIEKSKTSTPTQQDNNHIYIGYGEDHNGNLLQSISFSKKNGYYYFVDKIENAGLIFGEIMHGLLYPALKNINIGIENGEIYDYKTNTWSSNLYVSTILSESEKIYHIRAQNPDDIQVNITAINAITNEDFKHKVERLPELLTTEDTILESDLTKYILRQKTQEYLYHARSVSVSIENASNTMLVLSKHIKNEISGKMQELRKEIKSFLEFLKEYIKTNNYTSDKFFLMLYEDIYIAYKTFGTVQGAMYTGSRQSSQGRQTSYVVSSQPNTPYDKEDDDEPLIFNKLNIKTDDSSSREDDKNDYLSVNTTPKQLKVMSSINTRSLSPPLLSNNDIKLEDIKPLTELDDIMLFNRRNIIN
jgi:translation initiation factor 2B subunit (eIF-2B alpha/beta/delta family)